MHTSSWAAQPVFCFVTGAMSCCSENMRCIFLFSPENIIVIWNASATIFTSLSYIRERYNITGKYIYTIKIYIVRILFCVCVGDDQGAGTGTCSTLLWSALRTLWKSMMM